VDAQYLGKRIGALSELQHGVKGEVFAVDSRTIHVKGFSYDGAAPGESNEYRLYSTKLDHETLKYLLNLAVQLLINLIYS
jgi:hypothetical protein